MKTITIYGASDDLVEVEGDIREEFYATQDEKDYIACSDGTVLSVQYGDEGVWRIYRVAIGSAEFSKIDGVDADSGDYSDKVTLTGDIDWIVFGSGFKKPKSA